MLFEKKSPSKDRKASPSQVRWADLVVIDIYVCKNSFGGYEKMWAGRFSRLHAYVFRATTPIDDILGRHIIFHILSSGSCQEPLQ